MKNNNKKVLTTKDVAIILSMSETNVCRLIRLGKLKAHLINGSNGYRIYNKDLQEYIDKIDKKIDNILAERKHKDINKINNPNYIYPGFAPILFPNCNKQTGSVPPPSNIHSSYTDSYNKALRNRDEEFRMMSNNTIYSNEAIAKEIGTNARVLNLILQKMGFIYRRYRKWHVICPILHFGFVNYRVDKTDAENFINWSITGRDFILNQLQHGYGFKLGVDNTDLIQTII